jgi:hypothetical protein
MASPEKTPPPVDKIFTNSQWQAHAEQPGTLEHIEHKWDEIISTKGPSLKAYLADLQLAYKMLRACPRWPILRVDVGPASNRLFWLTYPGS